MLKRPKYTYLCTLPFHYAVLGEAHENLMISVLGAAFKSNGQILIQDIQCFTSGSSEGSWPTAEAVRGFFDESERHLVGRTQLGTPCIGLAHSTL
jgi:hypothetical protein